MRRDERTPLKNCLVEATRGIGCGEALGTAAVGRTIRFLNSALCPQISFATPTLSHHCCMRTNMSYAPEKDSIVVETPPRGGMLGALQSSFRVIQGHLGMKAPKKRCTSPPSYEAVLLQKNSKGNSQIKQLNVYEFLGKLGPTLPPITARRSEMGVEKQLTALFATGTNSTLEWARRNPIAVIDRVRHFLFYCVARDSDLDHLLPLSQSDREYYHRLATTYVWSWLHQIVYGWDKTPHEVQARAYEVFCLFIENPIRRFGLPFSFFLTHLRVFKNVHELPQGSSLFGGPPGTRIFTLQEIRSRGEFGALGEVLRMNNMILDAIVDPVSRGVYATLKRKMEAERQMSVPPRVSSKRWRYVMNDQPGWIEFKRINCNKHSNFAPLRRREDEDDRRGMDENAQFSNLLEIRHELKYNPWA
jgi:hypothetical protein